MEDMKDIDKEGIRKRREAREELFRKRKLKRLARQKKKDAELAKVVEKEKEESGGVIYEGEDPIVYPQYLWWLVFSAFKNGAREEKHFISNTKTKALIQMNRVLDHLESVEGAIISGSRSEHRSVFNVEAKAHNLDYRVKMVQITDYFNIVELWRAWLVLKSRNQGIDSVVFKEDEITN